MTVFLMAARCLAWIQMGGLRHPCELANDHTGYHTATVEGNYLSWSNR